MARRGNYNFYGNYSWYVPGVADMFILLALLLAGALLGGIITSVFTLFLSGSIPQEEMMEYAMFISYPLMFIPPMIYASVKSRGNSFNHRGFLVDNKHFSPLGAGLCALLVIIMTVSAGLASEPLTDLLPPMPDWLENTLGSLTTGRLWINFLMVSIFAPFFEEWLCRGMVLRGLLCRGMKPAWAIAVSALFFAVIHMNPWQAIPAFILGCLFGYVYYKTGALKLTMLMHFTNNTVALVIGQIDSLAEYETWTDLLGGKYWLWFAVAIIILLLGILAFRRIPLTSPKGNCDEVPPLIGE